MKSTALPIRFYGNPADVVERNQLDQLGCRVCESAAIVMSKVFCAEPKNENQKGVPRIGHRCKYFNERKS